MSNAVVAEIRIPPKVRITRAGLSLVKTDGLWWVVPSANPSNRMGDGFHLKSDAQKAALGVIQIMRRAS